MIQQLQQQFAALEKDTQATLSHIASLSKEQQNFKSSADSWSLLEVVEHLVKVEESYNLRFKENDPAQTNYSLSFSSKIKLQTFKWFSPFVKAKAPSFAIPTQSDLDLNEWRMKWKGQRSMLRATLEQFPKDKMNKSVAKHAFFGPLSMSQTIDFLHTHLKHHKRQIKRIQAHQNFPK